MNVLMLASYYSNTLDTHNVFDKLNISKSPSYLGHLNKHNVVYISFDANASKLKSYDEYIAYFENRLKIDLKEFYTNLREDTFIPGMFDEIYRKTGERFVFIIDEWDYIFNNGLYSEDDKKLFYNSYGTYFVESLI